MSDHVDAIIRDNPELEPLRALYESVPTDRLLDLPPVELTTEVFDWAPDFTRRSIEAALSDPETALEHLETLLRVVDRHEEIPPDLAAKYRAELTEAVEGLNSGARPVADALARFWSDACEVSPAARCLPVDLFAHYVKWARRREIPRLGKHAFYHALRLYGPPVKKGRPKGADGKQETRQHLIGIAPICLNHQAEKRP